MKKIKGFSGVIGIVIGIMVATLFGIATYSIIDANSKMTNFDEYDFYSVIEPTRDNGNIGDHIKGGSDDAPVLVFEYADYQCPGCASMNSKVNSALEAMDGKVALVYRNFLLSYHQNGTAAASAAEAASIQGYWKPYADKLFASQSEWEYLSASERTEKFNSYFVEVTGGQGDLEKFNADIASAEVSKKISFDMGIGQRIGLSATPAFFAYGQPIDWTQAGQIVVNGKTIYWEDGIGNVEGLTKLFNDMFDAINAK